jgi:hypothetical protein
MTDMKRILASLFALALLTTGALAWFVAGEQLHGFEVVTEAPPPGGGDPTISAQGCTANTVNAASYTFTAHAIGAASATRHVAVLVSAEDSAITHTITGITLDTVGMTEVVQMTTAGSFITTAIFIISDTTGTTGDIVVTDSEGITNLTICVYAIYDLTSAVADSTNFDFETASAAQTLNINTTSPGIALAICGSASAAATTTWTGLTEAVDTNHAEGTYSTADLAPTSASTPLAVTCDFTGTDDSAGVAAAWN